MQKETGIRATQAARSSPWLTCATSLCASQSMAATVTTPLSAEAAFSQAGARFLQCPHLYIWDEGDKQKAASCTESANKDY